MLERNAAGRCLGRTPWTRRMVLATFREWVDSVWFENVRCEANHAISHVAQR